MGLIGGERGGEDVCWGLGKSSLRVGGRIGGIGVGEGCWVVATIEDGMSDL